MSDRLKTGLARLAVRRNETMTGLVTYRRGAHSVEVSATIGETVFNIVVDYGAQVRVVRRDYLISTADLILDSEAVLPEPGDRIDETDGDTTFLHEVMGPGGAEPCWRYSGGYRGTLRVHTKQVGTEAGE